MKVITIVIFLILFVVAPSCSVNKYDINRFQARFESKRQMFETLVQLLDKQNLRVGHSINENELPENVQEILQNLEISTISLNHTQCQGVLDYQLTTTWSRTSTLYFSKDKCDKIQTVKGYHSKHSEMIEVWGLGEGWIMWIDYDFI